MDYARPRRLEDALSRLGEGGWRILAGGTDVYPGLHDRPVDFPVLDVTALADLRRIGREGGVWRIGALATWTDILRADLPTAFDGLKLAAREVGSVQIQNRATVAGNLCNASPAADGVPPLLTLDARLSLVSASGAREVALADFVQGNRRTALRADEMVEAILIPEPSAQGGGAFVKLGARRYLVISIAMVAARIACEGGRIAETAVSGGACSAVAQRLPALEAALTGAAPAAAPGLVAPEHLAGLAPLDDVRAPAAYRREAAAELVRRAIREALA